MNVISFILSYQYLEWRFDKATRVFGTFCFLLYMVIITWTLPGY